MSRYEDDRWAAIDRGELPPPDDEPEPPPRRIRNVLRDLADYQPTH